MEEKYCRIKKTDTAPFPPWKVPQSAAHQVTRVPSILPSKFHLVEQSFIHFSFLHPSTQVPSQFRKISIPSFLIPPLPLHVIQNLFPLSPAFPSWKEGSPPQGRIAYFSGIVVSERAMFSHRSKVGAEEGSGGDQNKAVSYISDGDIVKTCEHSKENNFTLGYSNYVSRSDSKPFCCSIIQMERQIPRCFQLYSWLKPLIYLFERFQNISGATEKVVFFFGPCLDFLSLTKPLDSYKLIGY